MIIVNLGYTQNVTLAAGESLTVTSYGDAVVTAVSGVGSGVLGTVDGTATFGPYSSAGVISVKANKVDCTYRINPIVPAFMNASSTALLGLDGLPVLSADSIVVLPSGGDDSAAIQAAANLAMASGKNLKLGAGTFNLNTAGIQCSSGVDINAGTSLANSVYKGLKISGAGRDTTKVNVNVAAAAFRWHSGTLTGNTLTNVGISDISIAGTGISSGSTGLQFGGVSSARTDLCQVVNIDNVRIDNVTSCITLDDVSILRYSKLQLDRFKYGWQFGYNIDDISGDALYGLNISLLNFQSTTLSNVSNSFTVGAFVAPLLQVGYAINCPGFFPAGTYVGSIVGTTITAVDYKGTAVNALASGATTQLSFLAGRVFNYGARIVDTVPGTLYPQYGSPFVSPYWGLSDAATRGRTNANQHSHTGIAGQIERVADIGGPSHFSLDFNIYQERTNEGYLIGDAGSTIQARHVNLRGCYIGFTKMLLTPWVNVPVTAADFIVSIEKCRTDNQLDMAQHWFSCPTYGAPKLKWEDNSLLTNGAVAPVRLGASNIYASLPQLRDGTAMYTGSSRKGDALMTWTNAAWINYGLDGINITLTASSTINNHADYDPYMTGKPFAIYATQNATGGFTLTLGTLFLNQAGAAIGTTVAGTANQKLALFFVWDNTYFRAINDVVWK